MRVYEALYNPCIHESGCTTLSIHFTKSGAKKAIAAHREAAFKEWREIYPERDEKDFGEHEFWGISPTKVLL